MKANKQTVLFFIGFLIIAFFMLTGTAYTVVAEDNVEKRSSLERDSVQDSEAIPISTEDELVAYLSANEEGSYYLTTDITLAWTIKITRNKQLDLNGHTITLAGKANANDRVTKNSTGKFYIEDSTITDFTVKNGHFVGGDSRGLVYHTSPIGVISVDDRKAKKPEDDKTGTTYDLVVTVENVTHDGTGFFKGKTSKVVFKGNVELRNTQFNVRALNIDFYGNPDNSEDPQNTQFKGNTTANGNPGEYAQSDGGINLSFNGKNDASNVGVGRRIITINKHATVNIKNDNDRGGAYGNNIGNFAQLIIDGELTAEAKSPSLRTTASQLINGAGTDDNQAKIYVNPASTFKIYSTNTSNSYGSIYTYSLDVIINQPKKFDIRYFGNGVFFYSYSGRNGSNFHVLNSDIAVWDKANKGLGNPKNLWQQVGFLTVENFYGSNARNISSSNDEVEKVFKINSYSRISNDLSLPSLQPDEQYLRHNPKKYVIPNNEEVFFGKTDYSSPGQPSLGKPAIHAEVELEIGRNKYPKVITNERGEWLFDMLNLTTISGGTKGTVLLTDEDKRTFELEIEIEDKLPPKATPKIIKVPLGNKTLLKEPKNGLASYSDETTAEKNLLLEVMTPDADLDKMTDSLGVKEIDIKVTDEAGNATVVTSPVIVHRPNEGITNGYAVGTDFSYDYQSWMNASESERKTLILEGSKVKGYSIDDNDITEVAHDSDKLMVYWVDKEWQQDDSVEATIQVNRYKLRINVLLTSRQVTMTVKQLYERTTERIIGDLNQNSPVNDLKIKVASGENLNAAIEHATINQQYEGYEVMDGYEVEGESSLPNNVPDKDFTVIYRYKGQLKLKEVPDLDFTTIKLSNKVGELYDVSENTVPVKVLNTVRDKEWTLSVFLENGFKGKTTERLLRGELLYYQSPDTSQIIGDTATELFTKGGDAPPISIVDVNGIDSKAGFKLRVFNGNYKDYYQGILVWNVSDTPNP